MGLLRILLAFSVLTAHMHGRGIFGFRGLYGNLAVQCFFMISGFYMALVLNEKYNRPGDYLLFLWQRFLRLYPAYMAVVILTLVIDFIMTTAVGTPQNTLKPWFDYSNVLSPTSWLTMIFANLSLVGLQICQFSAVDPATGHLFFTGRFYQQPIPSAIFEIVGQAWTLGLEVTFYVLAPFMVRRAVWVQALIVALSVLLRITTASLLDPHENPWHTDRFFPYELAFFMAGSLSYQIYRHQKLLLEKLLPFTSWFRWVFIGFIVIYSRLPGNLYLRESILIPLLFLMIPLLFDYTKNNRRDRLIGELSYPFYLVHVIILSLMRPWVPLYFPKVLEGPIYGVMVLILAYLLYRGVDQKVDDFRHRLLRRRRAEESKDAGNSAPTESPLLSQPANLS